MLMSFSRCRELLTIEDTVIYVRGCGRRNGIPISGLSLKKLQFDESLSDFTRASNFELR